MRLLLPCLALPLLLAPLGAQAPPLPKQAVVDRIIDAAMKDDQAYANLEWLCDRIGNRLAGSPGLEKAVAWAQERMKAAPLLGAQGGLVFDAQRYGLSLASRGRTRT